MRFVSLCAGLAVALNVASGSRARAQIPVPEDQADGPETHGTTEPGEPAAPAAAAAPMAPVAVPLAPPPASAPKDLPPARLSFALGAADLNGKPFHRLLQDGTLSSQSLAFDWQPSRFGVRLGMGFLSSTETHNRVSSRYDSTEFQAAGTYVPPLPWDGVQVIIFAGALAASQRIVLDDGEVNLSDASADFGPFAGVDVGTPPLAGFRLFLRLGVSEQKVHFRQFAFQHDFVERSALIGGSYAF